MASRYSLQKDFGLHRLALPEQETQQQPDAYNQAMPGSSSEGRVQKRVVSFAVDDAADAHPRKKSSRRSWSKKMRGLFKGSTKRKVADKRRNVVPVATTSPPLGGIDAVVLGGPSYGAPAYPGPGPTNPNLVGAIGSATGVPPHPAWGHEGSNGPPRAGENGQGVEETLPEAGRPESEEIGAVPPQLIRLSLLPEGTQNEVEIRQVTLRQKASGFGLHLSAGLPPIRVTYIEPGREAELAGVKVGDLVVEVNGRDCRNEMEIPQIMELKMLIQRVKVRGREGPGEEGEFESSDLDGEPAEISVDDAAWQKIKQVQEDIDSQDSANLAITHIDDVSERSSIKEGFQGTASREHGLGLETTPSGVVYSKTAPALSSTTRAQKKSGKGKFIFGKKKKSPSSGDIAGGLGEGLKEEGLKRGKGKKASKSKKKSASKDSDGALQKETKKDVSPVALEDYDGGEEPRRVGGRVAAMSHEDMPQLRQLALARKDEGLMRRRSGSLEHLNLGHGQELKEELRATSRSQTDVSTVGVDLEANVRVKKSGVVIGPSARGSRRPSIFDQEAGDVDLSAIPQLAPSLGLREGHARRDLAVSRSSIKRRPASQRRTLLLDTGEKEKMGTARVTLSEGEKRPVRTKSTPTKFTRSKRSEEKLATPASPTGEGKPKPTSPAGEGKPKPTSPAREGKPKLTSPTGEGKPPKPTPVHSPSKKNENILLPAQRTSPPRVQRQGSSGSTAELVARAAAMRKRQSFETSDEKGSPPESHTRRTSFPHAHTPGGFNLLADISHQSPGSGNGGQEKQEPLSRRLFPTEQPKDTAKEVKKAASLPQPQRDIPAELQAQKMQSPLNLPSPPEPPTSSGRGSDFPTAASKSVTRRLKSVEKPVKTLGIASERETAASSPKGPPSTSQDHPLRATEVPENRTTPGSDSGSSSNLPAWVSIAHNKQKRVSIVYGLDGTPTRPTTEAQVQKDTPSLPRESTTPTSSPGSKPTDLDSSMPRMGHVKDRLAIFQQKPK